MTHFSVVIGVALLSAFVLGVLAEVCRAKVTDAIKDALCELEYSDREFKVVALASIFWENISDAITRHIWRLECSLHEFYRTLKNPIDPSIGYWIRKPEDVIVTSF